jgi:hypothetical protein
VGFDVLTTCQPSTVWCSRERLPEAAAQPAKVRQSCSATDLLLLYAEVPLWCASGPIARRWIVPTCVWKLYDCKNESERWKIATRGPVGRIL